MSSYSPLRSSSPLLQSHSILQTQNQTQKFKKTKLLILLNLIITSFLIFIWYLFQPKPSTSQSPSLLHSTQPKLTLSDNLSQILSILSNPWGNPHQDQELCNPYTQAGYLNFSLPAAEVSDLPITSEHHLNLNHQSEPIPVPNWVSFDESECEAKDHMTQILRSEYEDWMYNSTIIVIGDSVERNNLEYVCDGLGADHQIYLPGHPLRPKPWDITLDGRPDPLPVPDRFPASEHVPQWLRNVGEREAAFRSCIIPSINFKMVSLFHYGLFASKATEDRIIATMGHFFPPARLELRIQYLLYPLLKNLKIEIEEIDLVEFSSGAWDLQEWNRVIDPPWSVWELRHHHQLNPINFPTRFEPFDLDSLLGYGHRLNEILNSLMDDLFPSHRTGFSIRSFHPIGISTLVPAPKFTQLGRFQTWNVKNLVRLRSSNARSQTPINHAWDLGKLEINPWGTLLEGQVGVSYLDAVHPGRLPGGWLWGNIVLDRLRRWKSVQKDLN